MVRNLVHNLCESLVENIDGVADTGKRTPPQPITYLTQWKIVGNSEVHGNEIWSCGEYSEVDNKWHIRILPEGYGIVDIALDEPLRKVNYVADSIEFADGVATLTRNFGSGNMGDYNYSLRTDLGTNVYCFIVPGKAFGLKNLLSAIYRTSDTNIISLMGDMEILGRSNNYMVFLRDMRYTDSTSLKEALQGVELIYMLATPTTETIQVPQIEEAESYSCVISQGGKAVEWSSFETE